jgi:hypothetical protein
MQNMHFRKRMFLKACLMSACLFEAVGCPQIVGNGLRTGIREFLQVGVPAAIIGAIDFDELMGDLMRP